MAFDLSLDVPTLLLDDRDLHLAFTSTLQIRLPDLSWLVGSRWEGLEMVRGNGLCLKIKLRWNGRTAEEALMEAFGSWISNAEMWRQLQFSTSLQVPGGEEADVIINLSRSSQTPAATELLLPMILPTSSLAAINLTFDFRRQLPGLPGLMDLESLADKAVRSLWNDKVVRFAPLVGKVGYLEDVSKGAEYVNVVADTIVRVAERAGGELKAGMEGVGVRSAVWRVLLDRLRGRKRRGGAVKSLVRGKNEAVEVVTEEDYLLLNVSEEGDEELLFGKTQTEDEYVGSLFNWDNEDEENLFDLDDEDEESLFNWDDVDEDEGPSLFELFEEPMKMGYRVDEKSDLIFTEDYAQTETLFLVEDEDMIWI